MAKHFLKVLTLFIVMIALGLGGLFVINHFMEDAEPAVVCCNTGTNAKTIPKTNTRISPRTKVAK